MYSRVKLGGHPIHPMLVAYPIAFYTATPVAYAFYALGKGYQWVWIAIAVNVAGVVMAVIAAIPGVIDWASGVPTGSPAKRHGLIHMALNVAALVLFAVDAATHIGDWNFTVSPHSALGFILGVLGLGCTVAAGYFGWTMVQDDHVGVNLFSEQERLERRSVTP